MFYMLKCFDMFWYALMVKKNQKYLDIKMFFLYVLHVCFESFMT